MEETTSKGRIGMKIVVTQPGDDVERENCSFCDKKFEDVDERHNTCTHTENVTLCRPCYNKAGNDVR